MMTDPKWLVPLTEEEEQEDLYWVTTGDQDHV